MKRALALLLLFLPASALAQTLAERVVSHRFSNGLTLLIGERHEVPIVSTQITYRVGSVDERLGETGLAHLFEHMAFKGTRRLGTRDFKKEEKLLKRVDELFLALRGEEARSEEARDREKIERLKKEFQRAQEEAGDFVFNNEIGEIYQKAGGVGFNAFTGRDTTSYVVSLPSNRLSLWAAIESDRMANTVLREFYKEKQVVLEERRRSVENSPSGKLYEAFFGAAFHAHPYGRPTLGWPSDLEALWAPRAADFFKNFYSPVNTTIAVVGDIRAPEVIDLVKRFFGKFPSGTPTPRVVTAEPPQEGERRVAVEFSAEPRLLIGYHVPKIGEEDDFVIDVIDSLLSDGRTSRLYRRLVKEERLVVSISTSSGSPGALYPNLFVISATPRHPHTVAEVESAIDRELKRLVAEPPDEKELAKVISRVDASLVRSLKSNSGLAAQLAYFQAVAGDWRYVLKEREKVAAVRPEDVVRVAKNYFTKKNRTVAYLVPPAQSE